ncbi:MAG: glutathione S-transferase [Brevundimonas sp.]|uniref:glutathione S-transferase family protein n=1 Tax=Brevundimonas sp. TaxID=1871086 RepID=UPI002736F0CD|nr:glutathione S-transferase [Brevundimonas sp.]MDP3657075.1 glutathione S-transferase [Brevundimonas sp.]MDZ4113157.1 glutathione S-transferase [Brevundimonas sp.]
MITVHHLNDSRSQRVLWLLEEMGLPYEVKRYQRDAKTMLAPPALKAVHPLGKSPVLDDGEARIAETGAIIEYLLEAHPGSGLRPAAGTAEGRRFTYWLHYAEGSAMTPLLLKLIFNALPGRVPFLARGVAKGISKGMNAAMIDPQIAAHTAYWEAELGKSDWFAGDAFSAADIMMSFPVEAAGSRIGYGPDKPKLKAFLQKIHARPAYQRALERGGPYSYA